MNNKKKRYSKLVFLILFILIIIIICYFFEVGKMKFSNSDLSKVDVSRYDDKNQLVLKKAMNTYSKINTSKNNSIVNLLALSDLQYLEKFEDATYDYDFLLNRINTVSALDNMDFVVSLGDLNSAVADKNISYSRLKTITDKFKRFDIPTLFVKGNHDCYFYSDPKGDITPEEYFEVTFKDYNSSFMFNDNDRNAPYYYVDIEDKKTRVCVLNCFSAGHYEQVINTEQLKFVTFGMLDFTSKSKPEDWTVVFFIHTLIPTKIHNEIVEGADSLLDILHAYKEGKKYDSNLLSVDFSNVKRANIAAIFTGHHHFNYTINKNGILIIGIDTMKYSNERGDTLNYSNYDDFESDMSFEILSIDTKNKIIYSTKVGNGENRFWNY